MTQTILSDIQAQLLETLIVKYGQVVTFSQILKEAEGKWDYRQTKNLVTKLVKTGWLVRIRRGLYAISDLSTRGFLTLSPYVVSTLLVPDSYVSFESALQHFGMFDQLSAISISVSLRMKKPVNLAGIEYRFIKTKNELFFGWQEIRFGAQIARIATPEKAIIDLVHFRKSLYSIDLAVEKLLEHQADLDFPRLNNYLSRCSITTVKIFGFIFDLLGINSEDLYTLIQIRNGTSWMLPGDITFNGKWRLYYNAYFDKYREA